MQLGYDHPFFILPFDQQSSFAESSFGFKPLLTEEQMAVMGEAAASRIADGYAEWIAAFTAARAG